MRPQKVLTVLGTRPEVIKLAPVVKALEQHPDAFISRLCTTAQHREMLDQALGSFELAPDIDLDIMTPGQSLAELTARAIRALDRVVDGERPDVVLVQGDTTTAFCAGLAAFYHRVRIGHVEAGLRTGDKYAPFPEEINRSLISQLADHHFAPTERARRALLGADIPASRVFVTGNTVIDALLWMRDRVTRVPPALPPGIGDALNGHLVLVTGHRRESFGRGFENICHAIRDVADAFPDVRFVYPVHLNPQVREPVNRILGGHDRIRLIEPVPYDVLVWLLDRTLFVLTDSGGIQEEAPSLGKPVLVMREVTERPEGIEAGNAMLVGVGRHQIAGAVAELLRSPDRRMAMARAANPYGDGHAAERIVGVLRSPASCT